MKNVHLIPTNKPSRLYKRHSDNSFGLSVDYYPNIGNTTNQDIYITNDEKVKVGDWVMEFQKNDNIGEVHFINGEYVIARNIQKKIILTTDPSLAPDVHKIDDEFLQWFVMNPTCEEVEVEKYCSTGRKCDNKGVSCHNARLKIVIPKEDPKLKHEKIIDLCGGEERFKEICKLKPKQETLEEAAEKCFKYIDHKNIFIAGAKWQQEQDRWKTVSEETPPMNVELLVKSPKGIVHLAHWRESYHIFTCQDKRESSLDWEWKKI